jgi:hypothetical protein
LLYRVHKRWIAANLRLLVVADLRQCCEMTPEDRRARPRATIFPEYVHGVPSNLRRFLPLILIAFFVIVIVPTLLKKKSTSSSCHPGASAKCVGADLANVDLSKATLTSADFAQADLAGADLHSANLASANLAGADINGADLAGATLTHARFRGANLTGADLAGAVNADLRGAIVCHTLLPSGHFPAHDC